MIRSIVKNTKAKTPVKKATMNAKIVVKKKSASHDLISKSNKSSIRHTSKIFKNEYIGKKSLSLQEEMRKKLEQIWRLISEKKAAIKNKATKTTKTKIDAKKKSTSTVKAKKPIVAKKSTATKKLHVIGRRK